MFDCSLESGISSRLYAVLIANFCDWLGCDDQIPLSTSHSSLGTDPTQIFKTNFFYTGGMFDIQSRKRDLKTLHKAKLIIC